MAKVSTREGARELKVQDNEPHQPNDGESKQVRFQHGTHPPGETVHASSGDESPSYEEISMRAYELWMERGRPHGSPDVDWHRAIEELRSKTSGRTQTRTATAGRS